MFYWFYFLHLNADPLAAFFSVFIKYVVIINQKMQSAKRQHVSIVG